MQKGYNYWLPLVNKSPQMQLIMQVVLPISFLCAGSVAKPGNWVLESSLLILLVSCFLYRIPVPVRAKLLSLISSLSNDQRLLGGDEISHTSCVALNSCAAALIYLMRFVFRLGMT